MTLPVRFTVCTYNIWTTTRWPERKEALQSFIRFHMPDILGLQELQADSKQALDEILLTTHQCIEDPFQGWTVEGNLYWNKAFFELVEYGAENIGIFEEFRRLFWVRLRRRDESNRTLFVSTAHYTWPGHPKEQESNTNSRYLQAQATIETLNRMVPPAEPLLFMGDLNDSSRPIQYLRQNGLTDCFSGLGRSPKVTHPALPTATGAPIAIDWLFGRGPLKPMTAEVVDFYTGDMAPSDHKPVLATYTLL